MYETLAVVILILSALGGTYLGKKENRTGAWIAGLLILLVGTPITTGICFAHTRENLLAGELALRITLGSLLGFVAPAIALAVSENN